MRAAANRRGRRNPKSQVPCPQCFAQCCRPANPKEEPSTNLEERLLTTVLGFESWASLELGAWDLELPPLRRSGGGRFVEVELHFRRFLGAGRGVEERALLEAEHLVQHV